MRVLGLTGGIGCGKSTVAADLSARGLPVIDADQVAREVVAPGTQGLLSIVRTFGSGVLGSDGSLDRKVLGALVFDNDAHRRELNAIVHPLIAAQSSAKLRALAGQGFALAIYDAALLVENGIHKTLAGLIVVTARPEVQRARIMARDGLSLREADARIRAQLPLARKVAVATHVVENSNGWERLRARVADLYAEIVVTYGPLRRAG
jgi:dephospho-CoA kinase